jgi:YcaO-like protein with predicted kinase domain
MNAAPFTAPPDEPAAGGDTLADAIARMRKSKPPAAGYGIATGLAALPAATWSACLRGRIDEVAATLRRAGNDEAGNRLRRQCDVLATMLDTHRARFAKVRRRQVPLGTLPSHQASQAGPTGVCLTGHDLYLLGTWINALYATDAWSHALKEWGPLSPVNNWLMHFYGLLEATALLAERFLGGDSDCLAATPPSSPIAWGALCALHEAILSLPPSAITAETVRQALGPGAGGWQLRSTDGPGERNRSLAETLARIEPVMALAGITRVPDVGALDNTGIPAFQCIRPDAQWDGQTFTVFGGKGETALQCKVSAIAEGIERYCGEERNGRGLIVTASFTALSQDNRVIHPRRFNMPAATPFDDDEAAEWVRASSIVDGSASYVPACAVFYPYAPQTGPMPFRYFTTGLAAGNDQIEALAHGMAEVIERDASALNRILCDKPHVDLASIDSVRARALLAKFHDADINVIVRYIAASDIGVPAFSVILEDRLNPDPLFVSGGYSANPNKEVALISALTEAALSRVGTISGAREDLAKFQDAKQGIAYAAFRQKYRYWFDTSNAIDYGAIAHCVFPGALDELAHMTARIAQAGLKDILWVDLSQPGLVLPVVKVLVPGIERYSFKMSCIGKRAKKMFRDLHGQSLKAAA